ncbi:MAG: ATPase domain-containing protein, partial [Solirubrobacterales bacterium]
MAVGAAAYDRSIAKSRSKLVCSGCGHEALAWTGQCPGCGEWNTLEKEAAPARVGRTASGAGGGRAGSPVVLRDVKVSRAGRLATGIGELDRVLGGGLMPGSLVLIGGSPGIGKSTMTGMALANVASQGHGALYVSGEESAAQVKL